MNPRKVTYSRRSTHAARAAHARGEREFKTYDTSAIRPKRSRKPFIIAGAVAALVVVVVIVLFSLKGCSSPANENMVADGQEVTVEIVEGSTVPDIAQTLFDVGLVYRTSDFVSAVKARGADSQLQTGVYQLQGGMSDNDLIDALVSGPSSTLAVTEGMKLDDIAAAVEKAYGASISASDFKKAASDASAYADSYSFLEEVDDASLEGFLFPKTYDLLVSPKASDVVRQMLDQYAQETSSLDYSYAKKQGLSPYEVLILASIVEKEGTADTYSKVAAVFYNRLSNQGDPSYGTLGSDATTAYEVGDNLDSYDWTTKSPYNTRVTKGLPPTPICSPSLATIQAVCSPEQNFSDYYFFSFWPNDQGGVDYFFDKNYDDHQKTIAEHS